METNWQVNPIGVGLSVAAAGSAIALEGALMLSVPVAIAGMAVTMAAPAAWVLWAMAGCSRRCRPGGVGGSDPAPVNDQVVHEFQRGRPGCRGENSPHSRPRTPVLQHCYLYSFYNKHLQWNGTEPEANSP